MLKKITATCAIFTAASSLALAEPAPYVGAGLGIVVNTSSSGSNTSQPGYFRGVPFNVFAGYGGVMDQCYLAGELFATIATAEITNNNGLKTSYGFGASIVPGVMLTSESLAYARAGLVRSYFSNANNYGTGAQIGLGLQTSLTQNVDLRGEYDFTAYRSVGGIDCPRQDAFNLSLVYKFE